MKPTQALHEAGQSLWLDNITRALLDEGILARYVDEYSVTGLTSNPTIFDKAIKDGTAYDADIAARKASGASDEEVFFELALADLRRAAGLFAPVHARTDTVDGWVSLEVSPLLARDTPRTVDQAEGLHRRAALNNLFIKIPGTPEGLPAIEECICAAVPVNVTLLFSAEQYQAAAEAYLRGVERRIQAGRNPAVASVASLFVSRWDTAVASRVPGELRDRLGIAVARQAYRAYRELLDSPRWLRLANEGARAQRLLWASTSVKDPEAPDVLYVESAGRPVHRQHHAGPHPGGVRRPRHGRRAPARRRRRRQPGHRRLRPGRHRRRVPGRRAAAPGSGGVRGLVAGPAGPDRSPARAALPVSMEHTLVTEPDAAQLAVKAAGFVADRIRSAVAAHGAFTCAVSGGQTPWLMLTELVKHDLLWSSVEIYQVDERVAPDGDPERNLTHLRQILGSVPVTLIPMPVTDPDLEAAAAAYASRLPARFDLVHLGLGADGHTASLVPGDPVLEVTDRLVAVTGLYRGHRRMTLTYPALARAEEAMWLVTGASKHDALDRLLAGDRSIPAARVQARRSVIFADPPAVHGSRTFQGAIFDVDGVLVDSPHYRAWRDALQELMDTEWADLRGRTSYCSGAVHRGLVPAGHRRQAAAGRGARRAGVLRRARRRPPGPRSTRRSSRNTWSR